MAASGQLRGRLRAESRGRCQWAAPFKVTGYQDRIFHWDHPSLVNFMVDQWEENPAGVHCENTKIWPFCVSGAGLGLQLYDKLHGKNTHEVFDRWSEYASGARRRSANRE